MAKNAYLVITDLHFGNLVTTTRVNYRDENFDVMKKLLNIAVKYRQRGYVVTALLLGDVFHNSYKDVTEALLDKDFFNLWKLKIGDIYTVMGNHEFTYYRANPFYTAIASIESERVNRVSNKIWTPVGTMNVFRVVDELKDGEVTFYFNHYNTGVQQPHGDVNIGLFHQELLDPQIANEVRFSSNKLNWTKKTELENSGILSGYRYCFLGHMHTVYGVWKAGDTYLQYLASLGRTNETEVGNNFLERNVPAVIVEDGKFIAVEDNFITLLPREDCIVEEVITRNHEKYEEQKEVKVLRNYIPYGDDPMENIEKIFREDAGILEIIHDLSVSEEDSRIRNIKRKMRALGIGN